jgi:PAS domain S-box-containing protein
MNGIITEINSKFLEILGYSKNEVIGRNIIDFVVAEQREKAAEQLAWIEPYHIMFTWTGVII